MKGRGVRRAEAKQAEKRSHLPPVWPLLLFVAVIALAVYLIR